ncbi:hypothetical protein [Caulobacter sp. UNC358MFTsu5.1]|uniref:hypothetical protein n=1 Tax=Caulobacter sp. UNC358MFTsu5.1 TaxID=1449049 RepID=UPI0004A6E4B0|nr:hypothetical protein [Caulobacter sp. UNC358MFTsu5.1]
MHALHRPQPTAPPRGAEIIPLTELNRARSHRVLDRGDDGPVEVHPWAYCFPRTMRATSRG